MQNSLLKYTEKLTQDNFIANDYTSKIFNNLYIPEFNDLEYIEYYKLKDNQTIEQVSFTLYKSTDYWDLLVLLNFRDPLFGMTYDFDTIKTYAEDTALKFKSDAGIVDEINYFYNTFENDLLTKNEDFRTLKIIKPGKLLEIMKILRKAI